MLPNSPLQRTGYVPVKVESSVSHAALKAITEVNNKSHGDKDHTFVVTEYLDDFTVLLYAVNTNQGKKLISRLYVVCATCHDADAFN